MTPVPMCPVNPAECERRFEELSKRLDGHDARLIAHGESLSALKVQVAMASAVGSLVGGGIVALAVSFVSKAP